jgi:uncharacterized protein
MYRSLYKMFSMLVVFALVMMALPMQSVRAVSSTLVINEIDYDQPGTDTAEFIELKNVSAGTINLDNYTLELVNGTGNGAAIYLTFDLPNVDLSAGDYYVICANTATVANCDLDISPNTDLIQNGAPDGSGIRLSGTLQDAVSYEGNTGAPYTEGSGVGLEDSSSVANLSISRCADGVDTDVNNVDLSLRSITPGVSNACVTEVAPTVTSTNPANGATNIAINANIDVTFSEAVNASIASFGVSCLNSGVHTATLSGGPTTFTLNPDIDFANSESCTVTVFAAQITDQDANDPPDNMAADFNSSFSTVAGVLPSPGDVVMSEVYGGGGNTGATYTNDFIELYNRTTNSISLAGWSLQYASATGTSWAVTNLSGSIGPGKYYLVQEAAGASGTTPLPTPDATGGTTMSATAGKVALVQSTTALSGSCPTGSQISDFVGYGTTANCFEGSGPTPAPSNTTSAIRLANGATDTDNNAADFVTGLPDPDNSTDPAPTVSSTTPANGAANVVVSSNIDVTFSEPVNVSDSWFSISCGTSGSHTVTVSGGPTTFTLNPDVDFANTETCLVTVFAAQVSDQDTDDPFDTMLADYNFSFSAEGPVCTQAFTPIYQIQGTGPNAAITGNVTTQGVVVGDFELTTAASGFYIQDLTGDGNAATSDGIFVFTATPISANLVNVGDVVRVTGFARERFNQTTINGSNSNTAVVPAANIINCGTGSVAATDVTLPLENATFLERYEGMLVRFPQSLVISEYFNYDQFGEIVLALPLDGEPRPFTGTAIDEPGVDATARTLANSLRRITLDDAQSASNPNVLRHPNGDAYALGNLFRGGDLVTNAMGVLGYDFSLYRIIPTGPADYTAVNPRPATPEPVGGNVTVAAMNTLNFFITPDYPNTPVNPLDNKCGPLQNVECRGWDSDQTEEFNRQRNKLLAALSGLNADVIGLNELENTEGVNILGDPTNGVTSGLNDLLGAGTYAYIDTGVIGTDAIRVGMIYKPAVVTPVGNFQLLTTAVDPRFIDTRSRPALAQTFKVNATGARFTVVVNHLKSKGSACTGDPDTGDGQGNCNVTRTMAAQALVDWLATDPTGSGDPDFIIMGDLNSYAMEDPIDTIKLGSDDTAGTGDDYINLIAQYQGTFAYSYTFDGQAGYLDHALANTSFAPQVTGAADWHINSDEPDVVDYDTTFKPAGQEALYQSNPYRSSDHDALRVGLSFIAPTVDAGGPYNVIEGQSVTLTATGVDPDGSTVSFEWDLDNNGTFETPGQSVVFSAASINAPATLTVKVKATDAFGNSATDEATVNVIYNFAGFFQPVDNLPTFNTVKAGQAIPVKFSLSGDQGLNIFAAGYPKSEIIACDGNALVDGIEVTTTAGSSSLSYDPTTGTYTYVWKTEKAWANTCRQLVVKLNDGTLHRANFKFTK